MPAKTMFSPAPVWRATFRACDPQSKRLAEDAIT
jgi:hypothetical protein